MRMFKVVEADLFGVAPITDGGYRAEWPAPTSHLQENTRLFLSPNDERVGSAPAWTAGDPPVHPSPRPRVHPDCLGRGIGTAVPNAIHVLRQAATRSLAPRVDVGSLTRARRLHRRTGMRVARQSALDESELRPGEELGRSI